MSIPPGVVRCISHHHFPRQTVDAASKAEHGRARVVIELNIRLGRKNVDSFCVLRPINHTVTLEGLKQVTTITGLMVRHYGDSVKVHECTVMGGSL
jgi:hypothetical protein